MPASQMSCEEPVSRTPGRDFRHRFRRDRVGVLSALVVGLFFVVAFAAPVISDLYGKNPYELYGQDVPGLLTELGQPAKPYGGVDGEFWFGVEPGLGRDVFTQLIYGIRTSLLIAVAVQTLTALTGILLGVTAGYLGGWVDGFTGRLIDLLLAFPAELFMITLTPVVTSLLVEPESDMPTRLRVAVLVIVMYLFGWTRLARLLRGQVLSLRSRAFVEAAKGLGASPWQVMTRELLPNLWGPILTTVTLEFPLLVTTEAVLSFLGVGMVEPTPDWGRMIRQGARYFVTDTTFALLPAVAMVIFMVAVNLLGDSIRDALDPKRAAR